MPARKDVHNQQLPRPMGSPQKSNEFGELFGGVIKKAGRWRWALFSVGVGIVGLIAAALFLLFRSSSPPRLDLPPQAGVQQTEVQITTNPKDGQKYVHVPAGQFIMGCSPGDTECFPDEKPAHSVAITNGFWIGQTEVPVSAYKRFVDSTGGSMPAEPRYSNRSLNPGWRDETAPMTMVTWADSRAYCEWAGLRLPTEAEWEYAARGGISSARYGAVDEIAWYADNSGERHINADSIPINESYPIQLAKNGNRFHMGGEKKPNAFLIFDMLGNVWEWTADWHKDSYYKDILAGNQQNPESLADPKGPANGEWRAVRGGCWVNRALSIRASTRGKLKPSVRQSNTGFRCAGQLQVLKTAP